MRIVILTTQTSHHTFFVREIARRFDNVNVVCESRVLEGPFDVTHAFERDRDEFERHRWFQGRDVKLEELVAVTKVESMNDQHGQLALSKLRPDIAIVFGTGRLLPAVIGCGPGCFLNLHGGDPEEYRGLDAHLWAIYHGDFAGLVTTLHRVNIALDDGDICCQENISLHAGMGLHELRHANTETCVRLAVAALASFAAQGDIPGRKQRRKGRYYSFMPSQLKEVCVRRFATHTSRLENLGVPNAR